MLLKISSSCCRLCMTSSSKDNGKITLKPMLNCFIDGKDYSVIYGICTGVNIREKAIASNPTNICNKCENTLIWFYDFKKRCQRSEDILNYLYYTETNNLKIEVNEDKFTSPEYLVEYHEEPSLESFNTSVDNLLTESNRTYVDSEESNDDAEVVRERFIIKSEQEVNDDSDSPTDYVMGFLLPEAEVEENAADIAKENEDEEDTILIENEETQDQVYKVSVIDDNLLQTLELDGDDSNLSELENNDVSEMESTSENNKDKEAAEVEMKPLRSKRKKDVPKCGLCPHCGKFSKQLQFHIQSHFTPQENEKYECATCGKKYKRSYELTRHKRVHADDKRYACEYCGEKFLYWLSRRNHVDREHTGERRYKCKICNSQFLTSQPYYKHMRLHTGEKPFVCDDCGKCFIDKRDLEFHKPTHSTERNFACKICSKTYTRKQTLNLHMKIHTGEKNYVCGVCMMAFRQSLSLKTHILKVHPEYKLPPPGTILSQKALRLREKHSQKMVKPKT